MTDNRVPTKPRQSAILLAWGTFLSIGGVPVILGAGTLVGLEGDPLSLVWGGLLSVMLGAVLLSVGVLRIAEHVDRDAGVKAAYPEPNPPSRTDQPGTT